MKKWTNLLTLFALVGVLSVSCNNLPKEDKKEEKEPEVAALDEKPAEAAPVNSTHKVKKAYAVLDPTEGFETVGAVTFTATNDGVRIVADIGGLKPGKHGFHIHSSGDCSEPDAMSAGDHFNPTNKKHGGPDSAERHAGDLGNLEANASGFAHYDRIDTVISLDGPNSIVGKSVIVHADPDDLTTDPSGNSGKRIACGPITIAE